MRALALTTKSRITALPGLPQIADAGVPGYEYVGWMALVGPAGLPPPITAKMFAALKATLADPKTKDALDKAGQDIIATDPEATGKFLQTEFDRHLALAAKVGLKPE